MHEISSYRGNRVTDPHTNTPTHPPTDDRTDYNTLNEPGADRAVPANYRPISNLSTISKVLERLALAQLGPRLLSSTNFCPFQSGFRTGHSTETALLELLNDVFTAGDDRRFTVIIGLDISAAFDTISHAVMLHRRQTVFGLSSVVLDWVRSYLADCQQYVKIGAVPLALRCTARQRPRSAPIRSYSLPTCRRLAV